jgi:hypothetical protein
MNFAASTAALDLVKQDGRSLKPTANWAMIRRRYRSPTSEEARQAKLHEGDTVVRDEGLLFMRKAGMIEVRTLEELGIQ